MSLRDLKLQIDSIAFCDDMHVSIKLKESLADDMMLAGIDPIPFMKDIDDLKGMRLRATLEDDAGNPRIDDLWDEYDDDLAYLVSKIKSQIKEDTGPSTIV